MQTSRLRRSRMLAGVIAALMLLPATAVYASPGNAERDVPPRAETRRDHRITSRPSVQIDHVYRGALDGAVGTHTWSGDVFDTGVVTTVSYDIALDADGVPVVSSVIVDDSTLPEGATYEIRDGSTTTRDQGASKDEKSEDESSEDGSEDVVDESGDDTESEPTEEESGAETLVDASVTASSDNATSDTVSEEGTSESDDESEDAAEESEDEEVAGDDGRAESETGITRFAGRAGVRFSMGDQWAGLLILVHGALGEEPVASVRTILVTPSPSVEEPAEDTADDAADEDERDRGEQPGRPAIDDVRDDRDPVDRDGSKDRGEARQRDGDRETDRANRDRDRENQGSNGRSTGDDGRSERRP